MLSKFLLSAVAGSLNVLETLWLLVVMAGMYFHVWGALSAVEDRRETANTDINGRLGIIAKGNIRRECFRLVVQTILVFFGIQAALRPNRPGMVIHRAEAITILAFFTIGLVFLYLSVAERIDRNKLMKMYPSKKKLEEEKSDSKGE